MMAMGVFHQNPPLNILFFPWQIYPYSEDAGVLISERRANGFVASLADIAWIDRDEEDDEGYFSNSRWHQLTIQLQNGPVAIVGNKICLSVTGQGRKRDLCSEQTSLVLRGTFYLDRGPYQAYTRGPGTPRLHLRPMMKPYRRSACWRRNWQNWELKLLRSC